MYQNLSLERVLVVTKRQELVQLCNKYFQNTSSVIFCNSFTQSLYQQYSTVILDISSLEDSCSFVFSNENSCLKKIFYLVPRNIDYELFNQVIENEGNFVTYPCGVEAFGDAFRKYSSNLFELHKTKQKENVPESIPDLMGYFVGKSEKIKNVRKLIVENAKLNTPVLLLGETGTGKTTAAKLIHHYSERRKNPFVPINLATVVDSLAESIFFGTCKGVFTDAIPQDGLIKTADSGTVFFDEADCAMQNTQSVLLTFVETLKMQKVGSKKQESVNTRLIFATNSNMKKLLAEGQFRNDLFFRISDNIIHFPTLRERIEDIPDIVGAYLNGLEVGISSDAVNLLQNYDWPGNIRELHKCLARAVRNCDGNVIQACDIDFGLFD